MASRERIYLTGLPHESLSAKYYPDRAESPTLGHLHALIAVANGYEIADDIKRAVMKSAHRYEENLERAIDTWNKQILITPDFAKEEKIRTLCFKVLQDAMILSYGSLDNPEERRRLIMGAIELLNTNISPN